MAHYEGDLRAPEGARFAIIASRWNARITDVLVAGARQSLDGNGVGADAIDVIRVPGAWEIPLVAARLAKAGQYVAIIALGCVIRGDTRHYEHVADGCAQGLMRVQLDYALPVLNGVLAVERIEDAEARAGGSHGNKGEEVALAAVEMAQLLEQLP
ncbi:6,7-dimethyl-8-ribityllumazine synthase [Pseudoxanthomonas indica]|uniref:6,7-dimethyl-8-ribityllumazine synthase n=1 Tax=Pseudoxanthomonas indica TaxID=428993 RepID=A0A1T5LFT5_9GAMM|nr:6,7-dimethyl-8-ribityllumazine synthase [Pseudoxanthomonas indica]GGD34648.1 6,7-dimethyl-8-ribityllumazine synthase [Pseudoxanthomonas indica]SKC74861.1 6,7-dimethyl-8-ribityllumazine synthase [Pseudoxanthomonas indica]